MMVSLLLFVRTGSGLTFGGEIAYDNTQKSDFYYRQGNSL